MIKQIDHEFIDGQIKGNKTNISKYIYYIIDFVEICKLIDDEELRYVLYYDDLSINRDYNSISDANGDILNIINKQIDKMA